METTLYKLTDENDETMNRTKWGENTTHESSGEGELCGPSWIHAYLTPELAVLLNPIHANFTSPNLWEASGEIGKTDGEFKVGCKRLTTLRRLPLPKVTNTQRVAFAILCALEVHREPAFVAWANNWLNGTDRTPSAATTMERAAAEAYAAAERAAWAAAWAAEAAYAAAERAAYAAAWAAWAAAWAKDTGNKSFSIITLAKKAVSDYA